MSRWPTTNGSDNNVWGSILIDCLSVSHNSDGTLNPAAVSSALSVSTVNVVLAGNGAPTGTDGIDGDYWEDNTTGNRWGPKASGSWVGTEINATNGRVLAAMTYAPVTPITFTITGTTLAAFSSANLAITFVAPASGNVLVRQSGVSSASAGNSFWGVSPSSSSPAVATGSVLSALSGSTLTQTVEQVVTGLTAGTSYTWYWIGANSTAGDGAKLLCGGPTTASAALNGPATMVVTAL